MTLEQDEADAVLAGLSDVIDLHHWYCRQHRSEPIRYIGQPAHGRYFCASCNDTPAFMISDHGDEIPLK